MKETIRTAVRAWRGDLHYRARVTLGVNLAVNCVYAVFEVVCGYVFRSAWMGTLAFYYIVLSVTRFFILRSGRRESTRDKWRVYRACGVVMLLLTIAVAGIHILTMEKYYAIRYPGYMIYAVATFTFYATVNAVRNVVVYRKMNDPVLSAGKAISLAVAAVSMYNLQSAMIAAFGKNDTEGFRLLMGRCTGAGVLLIIVGISAAMLHRANRALRSGVAEE